MDAETILARCVPDGDCLIWTGSVICGCPIVRFNRKSCYSARRIVYDAAHPDELALRVKPGCGNNLCLNPAHLVAGKRTPSRWPKPVIATEPEPGRERWEPVPVYVPRQGRAAEPSREAIPPNSPQAFAICDAVRREMCGPDKPGHTPWLNERRLY
jgi:hypothetical protein